jgi:hypothetical protein
MKTVDLETWRKSREKDEDKSSGSKDRNGLGEKVFQLHAGLVTEVKRYRGTSKIPRLGVLQKYERLIEIARRSAARKKVPHAE